MIHQRFLWTGYKEQRNFLFAYFMAKEHPEEVHWLTFSPKMQMLLRGNKILKSEILFCDFPPASSFLTGCSAHCSSTSSSWWIHIISRKSADPVQQIENLLFSVTFWPSEVIHRLPGIWSYAENYEFKRSEGERIHLPEKYSSSKHSSDHIVFGEEKKILTSLAGYEKNPFLPLVQCCWNSSWGGLWVVLLQITAAKPQRSQSTGPQCDLVNVHFTCSGGHFVLYLLAVLVQKAR